MLGEISITQICRWQHAYGRKQRGTKELLDEGERWQWKAGLKLNIQKMKIMASGSITSWQIDGETMETVTDFILGGSKNHWRWWLQPWNYRMLAPWNESYDKPRQCIKNQRYHFNSKILCSQNYGFSSSHVRMWELDHKEGWVPKNWFFQTVVLDSWRIAWTARRSNQSILKAINPEYALERLMLKLKLL